MATWIEDDEVEVPLNEGETLTDDDGVAQALEPRNRRASAGSPVVVEHQEELPEKYRNKICG